MKARPDRMNVISSLDIAASRLRTARRASATLGPCRPSFASAVPFVSAVLPMVDPPLIALPLPVGQLAGTECCSPDGYAGANLARMLRVLDKEFGSSRRHHSASHSHS